MALPAHRHRAAGRPLRRAPAALLALFAAGCAARAATPVLAPAVSHLASELDSAYSGPEFARAMWGVVVQSLDNGEVLYRRNAERLFMPASNQKLVTSSAALARLGADFRFRTGVLASLRPWADSLRARGIRTITGRVVGDGSWFTDPPLGQGWAWDYLSDSYAAPVGALQFNEGFALLEVTPGDTTGAPARAGFLPSGAPLRLLGSVTTAPRDSAINDVEFSRAPFTDSVTVSGRISAGRPPVRLEAAVLDPARYFETALTQALLEAGITVRGTAALAETAVDTLFVWQSAPLRDILPLFLKPSQNQIGETLLRTIGGEAKGQASVDSGRAAVREVLRSFGVADDAYVIADGSGLSRYDYVAPETLARILIAMAGRPDFDAFHEALPVAGVDGTIAARMRGTAAAGNVHAKTGSIANVRALSGYVTTADGERLVFVMIANHFTVPRRVVEVVQDRVLERLANFSRRPNTRR